MKKMIAKKILFKKNPRLVFVIGSYGKSMFIASAVSALRATGEGLLVDFNLQSFAGSLASRAGQVSPWRHLLSVESFPELALLEVDASLVIEPKLMSLISSPIVVLTSLSNEDLNQGGVAGYVKRMLPFSLKEVGGQVIYNADIPEVVDWVEKEGVKAFSFGVDSVSCDLRATNIAFLKEEQDSIEKRLQGIQFKVQNHGSTVPAKVMGGIGKPHLYSTLAALALCEVLSINPVDALPYLKQHQVLPGRMRLIPGIKRTLLIDDSYDSSVEGAIMAVEEAGAIELDEGQKRVAILGEIDGLGAKTEAGHCLLGEELANNNFDFVVGVGEKAYDIVRCAEEAGMDPSVLHHFPDKDQAGRFVQHELRKGDLVLIKGSKAAKFETVVKELMAFPLQAKQDLLVR